MNFNNPVFQCLLFWSAYPETKQNYIKHQFLQPASCYIDILQSACTV